MFTTAVIIMKRMVLTPFRGVYWDQFLVWVFICCYIKLGNESGTHSDVSAILTTESPSSHVVSIFLWISVTVLNELWNVRTMSSVRDICLDVIELRNTTKSCICNIYFLWILRVQNVAFWNKLENKSNIW